MVNLVKSETPLFKKICRCLFLKMSKFDFHDLAKSIQEPKNKYMCKLCCKFFRKKYNLEMHMTSHSNDRPHKCPFCIKSYKRRSHLQSHM